jgi:tetratricopeptide (TPR) repeat protein
MNLALTIWKSCRVKGWIAALILISTFTNLAVAQDTIFQLFKSDKKKADEYFNHHDYRQALTLYLSINEKYHEDELEYKIARCYYFLNQPQAAVAHYRLMSDKENTLLPTEDVFIYAESLSKLGQYDKAIEFYTAYLKTDRNDPLVKKKIWRLKNRSFLYEDSIHFSVRPLTVNTEFAEIAPTFKGDSLIFLSNRKRASVIEQTDENNLPFYRWYAASIKKDTSHNEIINRYQKTNSFGKGLNSKFQNGPVAFFKNNTRMIYAATGETSEKDNNKRTLQLYFAKYVDGGWEKDAPFDFNNKEYSFTDPWMNDEGTLLYFTSDMRGGHGGKDLYRSTFVNGKWTKPYNLGTEINTAGDESFPFVQNNTLYFTSNGHAGLGGLDIFKSFFNESAFEEVQNMGYPINTNADDFALTLIKDGVDGFLTSNRKGQDDIYEISIDLQQYPFVIDGLLKYKTDSWVDSSDVRILPNARLFLIDNLRNLTVATTTADAKGLFSIAIPYFSQYLIKVLGKNKEEDTFVSLDLSKRRKAGHKYEIVIVRNVFNSGANGEEAGK